MGITTQMTQILYFQIEFHGLIRVRREPMSIGTGLKLIEALFFT